MSAMNVTHGWVPAGLAHRDHGLIVFVENHDDVWTKDGRASLEGWQPHHPKSKVGRNQLRLRSGVRDATLTL